MGEKEKKSHDLKPLPALTYDYDDDTKFILFTGKPRQGKSSTINALLQEQVAESTAGIKRCTLKANAYKDETRNIVYIDTPGLFAGDVNEDDYVDTMSFIRRFGRLDAVVKTRTRVGT